jgi:hypothetical protein
LVGAHDARLARTEEISLPDNIRSVYVNEQEPEITHLEKISVRTDSGEQVLGENIVIGPGHVREFVIPDKLRQNAKLIVRGYYELLHPSQMSGVSFKK